MSRRERPARTPRKYAVRVDYTRSELFEVVACDAEEAQWLAKLQKAPKSRAPERQAGTAVVEIANG